MQQALLVKQNHAPTNHQDLILIQHAVDMFHLVQVTLLQIQLPVFQLLLLVVDSQHQILVLEQLKELAFGLLELLPIQVIVLNKHVQLQLSVQILIVMMNVMHIRTLAQLLDLEVAHLLVHAHHTKHNSNV